MNRPRSVRLFCVLALLVGAASLRADDVTDSIDEAIKAYKAKDFSTAAQSLEAAAQLVRQKRGELFKTLLPEAPSGWKAEDATSQSAGASMFGGGVTSERRYGKEKSEATMTVKFLTDSPVLQGLMMMFNNPMFATADGGKLERIKGQKAIVKFKGGEGSANIVVNGTLLIQIEGSQITEADLRTFASAIDYAKLTELL